MLVLTRHENETWLQAARRQAAKYGLEADVTTTYHRHLSYGATEEQAAFEACFEWDVLEYEPSRD